MALPPLTQELLKFLTYACAFGADQGPSTLKPQAWEGSHFDIRQGALRTMGRTFGWARGREPGKGLLFTDARGALSSASDYEQLSEFLLAYGWRRELEPAFQATHVWHPPESACKKCKKLLACSLANL